MSTTTDTLGKVRRGIFESSDALDLALDAIDNVEDGARRRDLRAAILAAKDALSAAADATYKP